MNWETIWNYVLPIGGGITVGGVIIAIGTIAIKSAMSKLMSKIDVEKVEKKAVDKGLEQLKTVTFKHSIQPLASSEFKKITETANEYIEDKLDAVDKKYDKLIECIDALASYFDNSIGVTEEKKERLHKAIEKAKTDKVGEIEVTIAENPKAVEKSNKAVEKVSVVR